MLGWTGEQRWRDAATRASQPCSRSAIPTASGHSGSTGTRRATWARCTASSETSRRSSRSSTGSVGRRSCDVPRRSSNAPHSSRTISRTGRPKPAERLENTRWRGSGCSGAHGRPGIISLRRPLLDEALCSAGAELTWAAGAHRATTKGAGICHGTRRQRLRADQGVRAHRHERWLERARRFAVHALAQVRRQREARGQGRYSLFTGDLGVALFLASCLDAQAAFPILDA